MEICEQPCVEVESKQAFDATTCIPTLIVMCGLQCSGKSSYAKELSESYKAIIVSSDNIRQYLVNEGKFDSFESVDNNLVFQVLNNQVNTLLKDKVDVIVDATNCTIKARKSLLSNIKEECRKVCIIMNTPVRVCQERLNERNASGNDKIVPLEVLKRYHESFQIPFYEEGWDDIVLKNVISESESEINTDVYLKMANGFNQRNKHHTQDLGSHMKYVGDMLGQLTDDADMISAGYLHDVGKLFTQTVGEDGNCHYYNHENVGAYNLMCAVSFYDFFGKFKPRKTLRILFYVNYHMKLHQVTTEKAINKWKRVFGDNLYNNLRLFERVDKTRPGGEYE